MARIPPIWLEIVVVLVAAPALAQLPRREPAQEQRQPPPPVPADSGARPESRASREVAEPLVHGPVHEAFAAPTPRVPEPPTRVSEVPPDSPEELPPPVAPRAGDINARWIPGYWGWDARERYVWISGTWRSAPPEMDWVPGYWARDEGGCRWVGGFWAHREEAGLAYLPSPPTPREESPPIPPDESHVWVPGNWQFVENEYRWKPGFWAEGHDDWIWIPDCYVWTPRGHIFVRGYWDLPLDRRGILFAPLAVKSGIVRRVLPTVAISIPDALVHWFVSPAYRHYYFGDYYDLPRRSGTLDSWYEYAVAGPKYDAMLSHYSLHDTRLFGSLKAKHKASKLDPANRPGLVWRDAAGDGLGGMAFSVSGERLPVGIAAIDYAEEEFAAVTGYYRNMSVLRERFEHTTAIVEGEPLFVQLDSFRPPGHGGLPPGLAKKGLVPPGFGGTPPGQTRKVIESFGPKVVNPGKAKGGGKGKGKGGGKGK